MKSIKIVAHTAKGRTALKKNLEEDRANLTLKEKMQYALAFNKQVVNVPGLGIVSINQIVKPRSLRVLLNDGASLRIELINGMAKEGAEEKKDYHIEVEL